MQPGRARISGFGVPLLPLAQWIRPSRPSASDPGSVDCCVLSFAALGACACAVSWPTWRLFTGARAVCRLRVLLVVASLLSPPPNFLFVFLLCICFVLFCLFWKMGRVHNAETGMGNWCSGVVVFCSPACVLGGVSAAAPQGCGSRILMYTGTCQGGCGQLPLCFRCWPVRRLCELRVWVVVTVLSRRFGLGVKGRRLRGVARVRLLMRLRLRLCGWVLKGRCRLPHKTGPVHRPSPPSNDGPYGKPDASVTGSTHANHRSTCSPRRTSEGLQ